MPDWMSTFPGYQQILENCTSLFASVVRTGPVPQHIGFIMDGNRRYARINQIEVKEGHNAGFESLARLLQVCYKCGVKSATIFAFSIENYKRNSFEVDWLMELAKMRFGQMIEKGDLCEKYGIKIRTLGDKSLLPRDVVECLEEAERTTANNSKAVLNVCFSYTSRHEITTTIVNILENVKKGLIEPGDITEDMITNNLYTGDQPPLDLLIRSSGVRRISDFLLWQCHQEHCDIEIIDTLWPEFGTMQMCLLLLKWSFNRTYGRKKYRGKKETKKEKEKST
ncbi:Cis-prenyltransferase [Komagataella phaffii CBS 7435]|uniref:Alkyl transferase n=2 Tax=Komagataella phaffii TaxID=460519 RepID=C4R914_KOMPG|nr:Cis-prenyltransferase involved in dolichol synthesis [Komagataella phaffii GS115]AOA65132.1 GQ67_05211T0 [Komagataella phaffii]CAH2450502.1 Cis-prenyltransferase [Komagataella phaffii CBS 7435]AOA69728.1 GQ68_05193T0 [Komagataella phaffii GS115]CAY72089.1 Cis-prenyltransferase involved in dolichol synthesis [Komagataella phaffii GS115]CCA40308.1 Cis-prenyltransferase [Komagataella phaffii CBS 7435]